MSYALGAGILAEEKILPKEQQFTVKTIPVERFPNEPRYGGIVEGPGTEKEIPIGTVCDFVRIDPDQWQDKIFVGEYYHICRKFGDHYENRLLKLGLEGSNLVLLGESNDNSINKPIPLDSDVELVGVLVNEIKQRFGNRFSQ